MERVISSRLSFLVAIIEPGLMDDPCDWDVCAEAASPATLSKLSSGTGKKKNAKSAVDLKSSSHRKPEKTPSVPAAAACGEETRRTLVSAKEDHAQGQQQAGPTRKELQDALPKIPPLSSFKSCRPRFVTIEEAELDFHSFISTGLGRSVDVIRDFRGQEDGEPSEESQSITLDDDSSECLKLCRTWRKSDFSHPSSAYGSSSSRSDRGDAERASASESQTEPPQTTAVPEAKAEPKHIKSEAAGPREHRESSAKPENCNDSGVVQRNRQDNHTAMKHSTRDESRKVREKSGKQRKKVAERGNRELRERTEEEREEEEEEEWSPEVYWRASYRAWSDYYASMSAFQSQDYQSCYSAAHSWMAAYRMNAVYMEELLKD